MLPGHPQILLYRPEIPQNVGAIGRLVAGAGGRLHLVGPFPFGLQDRNLRRPGLDYWPFLDLEIHKDLGKVLQRFQPAEVAFFSKRGQKPLTHMPENVQLCVFGQETKGLPDWLHQRYEDSFYRIPIYHPGVRSINLANAASIVTYHLLNRLEQDTQRQSQEEDVFHDHFAP